MSACDLVSGPDCPVLMHCVAANVARADGTNQYSNRSQWRTEMIFAAPAAHVRGGSEIGLGSGEIRNALSLDVREVPRILRTGVASKKLRVNGQKRGTVYSAA